MPCVNTIAYYFRYHQDAHTADIKKDSLKTIFLKDTIWLVIVQLHEHCNVGCLLTLLAWFVCYHNLFCRACARVFYRFCFRRAY